jgi:hypothetical protein
VHFKYKALNVLALRNKFGGISITPVKASKHAGNSGTNYCLLNKTYILISIKNYKIVQPLWEKIQHFPKMFNVELSYHFPLLGIH